MIFFKTATEQRWAAASVLTLLSSDNLLAGYEQLSWFMFHKKFNQDLELSFLS